MSEDAVDGDTEGEAAEGDGDIDSDINAEPDIIGNGKLKDDYVDDEEPSPPESSEKGENEGQLASNEQGKEVEPNQADQIEYNTEGNSEQFDPNELENTEGQNEFDPNVPDTEGNPDEFNPNAGGERYESDFDPNAPEGNVEQEEFEPNEADEEGEPDQFNPNEGRENYEGNEYDQHEMEGDDKSNYDPENFEQEEHSGGFYENRYAESMNTILLSENLIYAYLQEYIELMGEKENEGMEQGKEIEVDQSKEEVSELEKFLEEERERIRLEQQQADLNEIIDPNTEPITNEEELEQEQEQEVGTQENISEEKVSDNEEEVENQELELEEDLQSALPKESIESGKFEEIEEKNEEPQEKLEEREINLKLNDNENEKYKQHQSETQFESDHEIYPEPIVHKKELELIREEHEEKEEREEFVKEGELSQISQELEIHHEINLSETEVLTIEQEEELEQDNTSPYKEKERDIEEFEDHQQELEEILEQTRKIEQEAIVEIEQERENSDKSIEIKNYEKAKKLYSQETGKRPIYSNKETKGFKEWLEQNNESGARLKGEQSKEQKVEQENEEEWTALLKNWLNNESGEDVNLEMKNEVKQIIEKYKDLDELTTRFQELYKQEQLNQLSQSEKMELRALVKTLQKSDPPSIVLFTNLRALKRYLTHQKPEVFSDKTLINRTLNHLFTRSPVKQLNKILKFQKEINKNQPQRFTPEKSINKIEPKILEISPKSTAKIERSLTSEPKNTTKPEEKQLSLEQIQQEMKKINWKNISENWTITTRLNQHDKGMNVSLDPTKESSNENPLYKHKDWLKSAYNNLSWNLNGTKLGKICGVDQKTISRWLTKFNIPTKHPRKNLFNEGGQKECGRCRNIKPHNNFGTRTDSRSGTKYLRFNCKSCMIELGQIKNLKNKNYVVNNIYGGELEGKCQKCNTGIEKLPSLEFHHPYPELKSKNLRMRDNWRKNIAILEKEKATILCKNCHSMEGSNVYNTNKSLINREINGAINTKINFVRKSVLNPNALKRVVQLVKKREVINDLYGGTCIGCRKTSAHDHLPAIQFHHRDGRNDIKGSETYKKIKNYEYNHMKEWLEEEECVALCGNCHKMLHSNHFERKYKEIIESKHSEEVEKFYNKIRRNVKDYSFPTK